MSLKVGHIDSINFIDRSFEYLFMNSEDYVIETVKGISDFKPQRWLDEFGIRLTRNIVEAKIIHTKLGLTIPLVRYNINKNMQTIIFAGVNGYTEKSTMLKLLLKKLWSQLQHCHIQRIDIAIDYRGKVPNSVIKSLIKHNREPFKPNSYKWNTTYYKAEKEGKKNSRLNFKIYDKSIKDKLKTKVERFETVFQGSYFHKIRLEDIKLVIPKMQKTIIKFSGIRMKIKLL
jgi:hypothetical protein